MRKQKKQYKEVKVVGKIVACEICVVHEAEVNKNLCTRCQESSRWTARARNQTWLETEAK